MSNIRQKLCLNGIIKAQIMLGWFLTLSVLFIVSLLPLRKKQWVQVSNIFWYFQNFSLGERVKHAYCYYVSLNIKYIYCLRIKCVDHYVRMTTHNSTSPDPGPGNKNNCMGCYNGDKTANNSPSLQHTDIHLLYLYQKKKKSILVENVKDRMKKNKISVHTLISHDATIKHYLIHSLFLQTGHANTDILLGLYFSPKCCSTKSHVTVRAQGGCKFAENTWLLDSSQQQLKYKPIH